MHNNRHPQCYALLIGIDCYLPNHLPSGLMYPSLGGCVSDIEAVEIFLKSVLHLSPEQIFKLTATPTRSGNPAESRDQWPTYANIVKAFHTVLDVAQAGDQIYLHYSGHGGRTPTVYPEVKGESGLDETLVPTDIGFSTAQYLRDLELAYLLKMMVSKQVIVTIVLDSCHSGSATRGVSGDAIRSIQTVDTTRRPEQSLVASREDLMEVWRTRMKGASRAVTLGSGWLPEPEGYLLLAACRASESAYEHVFEDVGKRGVLTYWFLDALKQIRPGLTYKQLHDRLLAKVHSEFVLQTPQLEGDGSRMVFGDKHIQESYTVNVIQIDADQQQILLNTGQTQAVRTGAQFVIYPPGCSDLTQPDMRQALVEVVQTGATDSWAKIIKTFRSGPIDQGAQAVLVDPGSVRLRRTVRLVMQDELLPTIAQASALKLVEQAIQRQGQGFISMAEQHQATDYQVAVTPEGTYEIWDPSGVPMVNVHPALPIGEEHTAEQVVKRLVHLARYRNIQQLDNADRSSPLAGNTAQISKQRGQKSDILKKKCEQLSEGDPSCLLP